MLDSTPNQPTKFTTKNWVKINDNSRGVYNVNNQIKFKTLMLRSRLCDYSDEYILLSGTITVSSLAAGGGNNNMQVVFKNCTPFTNCRSEINNTQIDNAKDTDVVMPVYNLIEYKDNYSKTSVSLWQYFRDETASNDAGALVNFCGNSVLFRFKQKITGSIVNDGAKAV